MRPLELLRAITLIFLLPTVGYSQVDQAWVERYTYHDPQFTSPTIQSPPVAMVSDAAGNIYIAGNYLQNFGPPFFRTISQGVILKYNAAGVNQWLNYYYSSGIDPGTVTAIAVDPAGNTYVTGTQQLGTPNSDTSAMVTVKFSPSGSQLWSVATNIGPSLTQPSAITTDAAGNVYVTGSALNANGNYDYFTVKFNTNGVQQWSATYDGTAGSDDQAVAIAVDGTGNVYVTGYSMGQTFGRFGIGIGSIGIIRFSTGYDYATIKYSSTGTALWINRYNSFGSTNDYAHALTLDAAGNVYVTGSTGTTGLTIAYSNAGTQTWTAANSSVTNLTSIATTPAGNVITAGYQISSDGTEIDYMTTQYNSAGAFTWNSEIFGYQIPPFYPIRVPLAVDNQGNSYVSTPFGASNSFNFATVQYSTTGVQGWMAVYNGPSNVADIPSCISVLNTRNGLRPTPAIVYVAGIDDVNELDASLVMIKYTQPSIILLSDADDTLAGTAGAIGIMPPGAAGLSNYPNPFHGATTITYTLPYDSHVLLQIFDNTGRLISTPVNDNDNAGPHNLTWLAGSIAPGVYQYRIIAESSQGSFRQTKQMVVQ